MEELNIEVITIGDEVLLGGTLDTNFPFIAGQLAQNGMRVRWHSTVGDNESDLRHQLRRAWNRADAIIATGGLGPTHDDITRPVLARFFGDTLAVREEILTDIRTLFKKRGLEPTEAALCMAEFPTQATPIQNGHGSAPGIHYARDGKDLFALPGVPSEMRGMVEGYVLPKLVGRRRGQFGYRMFRTTGAGETRLAELIGEPAGLGEVELAYLPSIDRGVTLRIAASGAAGDITVTLDRAEALIRQRIDEYIYATGDMELEAVILNSMRARGLTLAVAESCTGGMLASRLVSVPGSSDVFERGFVTYTNRAKTELLGVDAGLIERVGAVSSEVAQAMAQGAREKSGASHALSITGIAGPNGGTPEKPVGLVYIGYASPDGVTVQRHQFAGDREGNRRRSAYAALHLLRLGLMGRLK